MNGFIDIHTHLLPGVDDGASDMAEALQLVRLAYQNGTRAIVLTPHFRGRYKKNSPERLMTVFSELSQAVKRELPQMELYLGSEAYYEQDLPTYLREKSALTLHDTRYCLLEFSPGVMRSQALQGISEITRHGFVPIIAHVERYAVFRENKELIDETLDMGALIQMNADSIMGKHGLRIQHFCDRMLKQGKVHFVATDAHDEEMRPPILRTCFLRVHKKYGAEYARQLFMSNGEIVIRGGRL